MTTEETFKPLQWDELRAETNADSVCALRELFIATAADGTTYSFRGRTDVVLTVYKEGCTSLPPQRFGTAEEAIAWAQQHHQNKG